MRRTSSVIDSPRASFDPRVLGVLGLLALVLPACDEPPPQVVEKTIAKPSEVEDRNLKADPTSMERFGYRPRDRAGDADVGAEGATIRSMVTFNLPAGWSEIPAAQFRDVNLVAGANGDVECYLTHLAGDGGGTRFNVNRWRGQFGLPDLTDPEFAALGKSRLLSRDAVVTEIHGSMKPMGAPGGPGKDDYAMIGMFAEFPAFAFSLKFVGPEAAVSAEKANFEAFAASLAFRAEVFGGSGKDDAVATTPSRDPGATKEQKTPVAAPGTFDPTKTKWDTPAGWTTGKGSSMRLVTYDIPGGAQCWVTPLGGAAGGVRANLDRWRKEVAAAPLTDAEFDALPVLDILGVKTPWLDLKGTYSGMGGPANLGANARVFAAACALPDVMVTIKMVGPADVLERERTSFQAFCESLEVTK